MAFTYTTLKNYIQAETRNQQDSVVPSLRTVINESIRDEISGFDYRSTQRHTRTFRGVYDETRLYPLPSDMMDEALVDIHKYKHFDEGSNENYRKVNLRKFNSNQTLNTFAFDYDHGVKWLAANIETAKGQVQLHTMNNLTENGTWTASDDGSAIALNSSNFISGSNAIQITGTGTANAIVNSTFAQSDISSTDFGFVWVYFPTTTNLSSVTLLYGSDASNYYSSTPTSPFNLDSFTTGWNLVGFDRSSETTTGSPDEDNIDYAKVTANYSSASTDVIIFDQLWFAQGEGFDLVYHSFYPWRTTAGVWQETSTLDTDVLNVDIEEYNVWKKRCVYDIATNIPMSDTDVLRLHNEYLTAKRNYQLKYPSQRKRIKSFY
jgi:hypothetical protein